MRKTKEFVVTTPGRDLGKKYLITEMPCTKAEKWALRALLALQKMGINFDPLMGMAGIASVAVDHVVNPVKSTLEFYDIEPLLDEMLECVQYVHPGVAPRKLIIDGGDVEEVTTLLELRREVLMLHVNFSSGDVLQS